MGQIVLLLIQFLKSIWNKKWNFIKTLYGQYGSNCIVRIISWSEFARSIAKFNIDWTIWDFDKDWSKFTKWTIRINPYCPQLKIFQKYFNISRAFDGHICRILERTIWLNPYFILIWVCYMYFWLKLINVFQIAI